MKQALEIDFTIYNPIEPNPGTADTTGTRNCILFGANFVQPHLAVTITPGFGVSYNQILTDSTMQAFTIGEIRMQSSNTSQVIQPISIVTTNVYGNATTVPVPMATVISEYQTFLQIARTNHKFDITGNVYFYFPVLSLTTVICTISIIRKTNLPLHNEGYITNYAQPSAGFKPLMIK